MQATWRQLIAEEIEKRGDGPLVACTIDDESLDTVFDNGYGNTEGHPFTAWTEDRVYFPIEYDGAEWCGSAPRNPCGEATKHQGGW